MMVRGHAHPPVRAFVRVEFWGQDVVSITDRHGRRYTDRFTWRVLWDRVALAFVAIGCALIVLPLAVARSGLTRRGAV